MANFGERSPTHIMIGCVGAVRTRRVVPRGCVPSSTLLFLCYHRQTDSDGRSTVRQAVALDMGPPRSTICYVG